MPGVDILEIKNMKLDKEEFFNSGTFSLFLNLIAWEGIPESKCADGMILRSLKKVMARI